jgi:hypothetical protein
VVCLLAASAGARSLVTPSQMETLRVQGDTQIRPDTATADAIAKAGKRVIGTFKVCIDTRGAVADVRLLKSTGYPTYDGDLRRGVLTWKYRPIKVPVCGIVTFLYTPAPKPKPAPITT